VPARRVGQGEGFGVPADRGKIHELYEAHRILEWGFVAWLIGAIASLPFWQLSFYTGPIATLHPEWGDLSYFVGFIVGAVAFALLYRLPPLWHRKRAVV
jgi:cytosine/uracil/thiamine/allantoin permease